MTVYNFYPDGTVGVYKNDSAYTHRLPEGTIQYDSDMKNPWWYIGSKGFGSIVNDYPEIEVPKEIQAKLLLVKE